MVALFLPSFTRSREPTCYACYSADFAAKRFFVGVVVAVVARAASVRTILFATRGPSRGLSSCLLTQGISPLLLLATNTAALLLLPSLLLL